MRLSFSAEDLRVERGNTAELELKGELAPIDLQRSMLAFAGPVTFSGTASNVGRHIVVSGTARADALLTCDRCLEEYSVPLSAELLETFCRVDEVTDRDADDEDLRRYGADDIIDLREPIEQAFVLQLPMKLLCSEGCRGLCPRCGANLNKGVCECPPQDDWGLGHLLKDL
ncbi:MAG: hypothetical protein BWY85_01870 [Firmicutes bacterium ADurb.Bin506]|jgi:uncharacterized protein|nr:MAG: hypothetical protein BWY85_01870 [Firmicutes bacterium ADurb.Bin506]